MKNKKSHNKGTNFEKEIIKKDIHRVIITAPREKEINFL